MPRSAPGRSRRAEEMARPIAASLSLPERHVGLIDRSHERCQALGLSRIERPDHAPLGRGDLSLARERNRRLHSHAAPVMEMLFDQIFGTQSMVVLCDATGTIIHSVGDDEFLARASKVALTPGVNWSEQAKGTNAIGTALIDEVPTLVHADEHYMHANHFLTCSAAPILDPRGNILGVLDVTGDRGSYHQHTMALVRMSARMIENHWLSDDFRNAMRLHFHGRVEFIGTLMEGILAVTPDGRIVGANRSALDQLRLSSAALRMHGLSSLFGTTVGALVDRFRSPLATPLAVTGPGGADFHLHARFDWPVWSRVTDAAMGSGRRIVAPVEVVPAAARAAPAEGGKVAPPALGLSHLDTGDAQMGALLGKVRRVLDRDIPVLILGETGTGKATLAVAIHRDSRRVGQPFLAVDCASMPASQLETELFGCEEGALAGPRREDRAGKIMQAHGGTLFLDEIGDMPLPLQARLLRGLQERRSASLGGVTAAPVDVALVCAASRDLRAMVEARTFREDLYYRLNGLTVRLPALRERSDISALVQRILDADLQVPHLRPSPDVQALFDGYRWPGNMRQLFNVLRAAAAMAGGDSTITREHLPDDFLDDVQRQAESGVASPSAPVLASPAPPEATMTLESMEVEAIRRAVQAAGGNISEASKRLGISRNTIYRKLRLSQRASA